MTNNENCQTFVFEEKVWTNINPLLSKFALKNFPYKTIMLGMIEWISKIYPWYVLLPKYFYKNINDKDYYLINPLIVVASENFNKKSITLSFIRVLEDSINIEGFREFYWENLLEDLKKEYDFYQDYTYSDKNNSLNKIKEHCIKKYENNKNYSYFIIENDQLKFHEWNNRFLTIYDFNFWNIFKN